MPTEQRQILFSREEVLQAIESYARVTHHFLPQGRVLGFLLTSGTDGRGVTLTISVEAIYGSTRAKLDVNAEDADTVALLIRCCLEHNIPIPRHGAKTTAEIDGYLALVIRYSTDSSINN